MREIRPSGSEGGEAETNLPSLPLSQPQIIELTQHYAAFLVLCVPAYLSAIFLRIALR